jgi:hypothetical protein
VNLNARRSHSAGLAFDRLEYSRIVSDLKGLLRQNVPKRRLISSMAITEQIHLLQWLIERTDRMRATYSNRAALTLSADAIILAAIVFLLKNSAAPSPGWVRVLIILFALLSLVAMTISLCLAIAASITLRRSSRVATRFQGERRSFLNPAETLDQFQDVIAFTEGFKTFGDQAFVEAACGELWVAYRMQRSRYRRLKWSMLSILVAFLSLTVALVFTAIRT